MAKFFLRTTKTTGTASLWIEVNRPGLGIKWKVNSGVKVDVAAWTKAQNSAKALAKYFSTEEGKSVQDKTSKVEGIIKTFFEGKRTCTVEEKRLLEEEINSVVNLDAIKAKEEVELRKVESERRKREEEANRLCKVWNYYNFFMEGITNGTLRQGRKNTQYRSASLTVWRTFGNHLRGYLDHKGYVDITFDDISRTFADGFSSYLESKGLMLGTINQQVNCFRRLCNAAAEDEKNKNGSSLKVWHSHDEKDDDKRTEIVLSDEEVDALYRMKLEGLCEQVRDVWMLGYLSAQRVSDFSQFTRDNFKMTKSGLNVIVLRQQKTGKEMMIPIIDERVMEICHKYDYDFPRLTRDTINRMIKIAAKELAQSVPSLGEWTRTLLLEKERRKEETYISMKKRVEAGEKLHGEEAKRYRRMAEYAQEHDSGDMLYKRDFSGSVIRQRWELITCHTSRRSAVTSMYDTGVYDVRDMMSISGHTTIRNFERYIKRDAVEQAESIAEKFRKAKEVKLRKEA